MRASASPTISRRQVIHSLTISALSLPIVLEACGSPAAPPSASAPANATPISAPRTSVSATSSAPASVSAAPRSNPALPTYIPLATRPKPDYASDGALYEDGYDNYAKNPQKSWLKPAPGTSSTVTSITSGLNPPSNLLENNPAWQAVNKALNANVNFNVVPQQDYTTRLQLIMAGDDLPDLMNVFRGISGVNGAAQFLQAKAADLTPYLAGDAAKDYPNLAAIPTFAWQNSGSAYKGKLYMVPIERYAPGNFLFKNDTVYYAAFGKDYVPKNADDLKRMYQAVNKPQSNQYATSGYATTASPNNVSTGAYDILFYASMFGAPNNWRLESDGRLTKHVETPEFKEAVGYVRDLVAAGLFSPDSLNYNINSRRADFIGGRMVMISEGFGQPWADFWRRGLQQNPPVNFHPIKPFAAHDGAKPVHYLSVGFQAATALKRGTPDRIKELLRILDWLAAPFGSQEDLLLTVGVEGVDYKLDDKGNPQSIGNNVNLDANYVNWKYIVQHPQVMYVPDIPGFAKAEYDAEHMAIPVGISDPTLGFVSQTESTKGLPLHQALNDELTDIMAGRRPLTDYDQLVKDWQNGGGETIRKEYMDEIAAAR